MLSHEDKESLSLLIVDDESKNIQLLGTILSDEGYQVEFATNGEDALDWVNTKHFDTILLDVMMPGLDGYEVCKVLKKNGQTKEIPIIFLTAKAESASIVQGFELGAADYILKPFNKHELLARVETHLELNLDRRKLRKANQDLENAMIQLEQQHQNVSHTLRTPTTVIHQYIRFLNEGIECDSPTPSQQNYLSIIGDNIQSMLKLIDQLLDLARLRAGFNRKALQSVKLNSVIGEVLQKVKPLFKPEVSVSVDLKTPDDEIMADREYLEVVLENLLSNSAKYTDSGSVQITTEKNDKETVKVSITDTGIGMKPDDVKHVFERFTRSENAFASQGHGLGLTITHTLVTLMDSKIGLDSKPGEGSTFWFTLKRVRSE